MGGRDSFEGFAYGFVVHGISVVKVGRFLLLPPCVSAIFERPIVHKAGAAEGPGKLRDLLISGKESVFKGLLDYHWDISHYICGLYIHS